MRTKSYDVAIIGLGAMGSAAALSLASRGHTIIGLEQFTPAHALGSSHGESRIIRQAYFEDPSYVPLLRRAYQLWDALEDSTGSLIHVTTGGLFIGPPSAATVTGSILSGRKWHIQHTVLDSAYCQNHFPNFSLLPGDCAVFEPTAGYINPERAIRAQLTVARNRGADLRFNRYVSGWNTDGSGVRIYTSHGTVSAERLVLTAGAWTSKFLGRPVALTVERQVMHWFRPEEPISDFHPPRQPVFIWEDLSGDQIYGFPAKPHASDVKIAFFRRRLACDPDNLDRAIHSAEIDEITRYLSNRLPRLKTHVRATACMYTLSPDGHFVIGIDPEYDQVTLAAGFSGHGFKFAPTVGEIVADLAMNGTTKYDIELFQPTRVFQ